MSINIKIILRMSCSKSFISIIFFILIFHGSSFAQWENTNLPSTVKVNTLAISDSNIFAGTDGDGIFLSTDNGKNWMIALIKDFKAKLYILFL